MRRINSLYPVNVKLISDRKELVCDLLRKIRPHKDGAFIGVCLLEGSFLCDNVGELYESVSFGERLNVVADAELRLSVENASGRSLGFIPFADSVLPKSLISRGIKVFCHLEAKEFNGGLISFGVSLYCDKY